MPVGKLRLEHLEPKMTGMYHTVSAAGYASVATWSTTRFLSISLSRLWASKIERKKNASGQFKLVPLDVDASGFVDEGLVVLGRPVTVLFEFEITSRFKEVLSLLAQERELRGM